MPRGDTKSPDVIMNAAVCRGDKVCQGIDLLIITGIRLLAHLMQRFLHIRASLVCVHKNIIAATRRWPESNDCIRSGPLFLNHLL